jgi:hypothetical protein
MLIEQTKYIAESKERILCLKGWVLKNKIWKQQVKLFETPCHIEQFFENSKRPKIKYKAVKVKVRIEVFDSVSEYLGQD